MNRLALPHLTRHGRRRADLERRIERLERLRQELDERLARVDESIGCPDRGRPSS